MLPEGPSSTFRHAGFGLDGYADAASEFLLTNKYPAWATPVTTVGITGADFTINGAKPNLNSPAEGQLMNFRAVQVIFDDERDNAAANTDWAYPDTGIWDEWRNALEARDAISLWKAKGMNAIAFNLQVGSPVLYTNNNQTNISTTFNATGGIKAEWKIRVNWILEELDRQGMVAILGFFYFGQDQRITVNDTTHENIHNAVDNAIDWLVDEAGYTHILYEAANETGGAHYDHAALGETVIHTHVINRARDRASTNYSKTIYVGTSGYFQYDPHDNILNNVDFYMPHLGGSPATVRSDIQAILDKAAYGGYPLVSNEVTDGVHPDYYQAAVIDKSVGVGGTILGDGTYGNGHQYPPTVWTLNNNQKIQFFTSHGLLASVKTASIATSQGQAQAAYQDLWTGLEIGLSIHEGTGNPADVTGNQTTTNNGADWGVSGWQRLNFDDAVDDYVDLGSYNPANQGTVAVVVRFDDVAANHRFFGFADDFELQMTTADKFLRNDLFSAGFSTSSTTLIDAEAYYVVVATWDIGTNENKIYINGALEATSSNADDDPGTGTLSLGRRTGNTTEDHDGQIALLNVYNVVWTDEQAERFSLNPWGMYIGGPQTLQPNAITSSEAFGTSQLNFMLFPDAISSAEAFGSPTLTMGGIVVQPTGITSAEAFGTLTILPGGVTVLPTGIVSAEAFGTPQLNLSIFPTGIASGEAFGTPQLNLTVFPADITTGEAFGSPQLNLTIFPNGIASGEAFGTVVVTIGGAQSVQPNGIATSEAFGTLTIVPGGVTLSPTGIASGEAFGVPQLNFTLFPSAIASAEAFGVPQLNFTLFLNSIPTGEAFGTVIVTVGGAQVVQPTAIASSEAFGTLTIVPGAVTLLPTAIPSAEAFGVPQLNLILSPAGILSGEAFGTLTIIPGGVSVLPVGIASSEAFGTTTVQPGAISILPVAIPTGEAFGSPQLDFRLFPSGIISGEAFGTLSIVPGGVTILPTGIPSAEAFGTPVIVFVTGNQLFIVAQQVYTPGLTAGQSFMPGLIVGKVSD